MSDKIIQNILNFAEYIILQLTYHKPLANCKKGANIRAVMRRDPEAETGFDFAKAANLGIEPIKPGETFRLIREIRSWEAEQILAMHPRGSKRLEMPKIRLGIPRITLERLRDFAEISAGAMLSATAGAIGGALAGGFGVAIIAAFAIPRMVITGEFPRQPTTADKEAIIFGISCFAGLGALIASSLDTWGSIENPHNRPFRFN